MAQILKGKAGLILISVIVLSIFAGIVSYQFNTSQVAPLTIDGYITGNEWSSRAWMTAHYGVFWTYQGVNLPRNLQEYCYLYLHADATYLYLCADLCGDVTNETTSEYFGVCIDTWNDDLEYPWYDNFNETNEKLFWNVDDNVLFIDDPEEECSSTLTVDDFDLAWSFSTSPNSNLLHRIFEVRILLTALTYTTWNHTISGHVELGDTIGVLIQGYGTMATNNVFYTMPMQGVYYSYYWEFFDIQFYPWMEEYSYLNWHVNANGQGTTNCNTTVDNEEPFGP